MRYLISIVFVIMMLSSAPGYAKGQMTQPAYTVCFSIVQDAHWQYKQEWMRPSTHSLKMITSDQCATYCF